MRNIWKTWDQLTVLEQRKAVRQNQDISEPSVWWWKKSWWGGWSTGTYID